jgi:hypothetical protein
MTDEYAEFWAARAKTPETRQRIRWLSRLSDIGFFLMCLANVGLAIWFWSGNDDHPEIFFWPLGITLGVTLIGVVSNSIVEARFSQAKFADAYVSTGVIEAVLATEGTDGEGSPTTYYQLAVIAVGPDGAAIRRHVNWATGGGSGSSDRPDDTWAGRRLSFRHNSLDPDDLADEQFSAWSDAEVGRR